MTDTETPKSTRFEVQAMYFGNRWNWAFRTSQNGRWQTMVPLDRVLSEIDKRSGAEQPSEVSHE
jgi:hypothetical protein